MESLPEVFRKIVGFLNKERYDYFLIGGIAVGILGDPRMTQDIDFCLFVSKAQIKDLLRKANDEGFSFRKKEVLSRIRETGTFQINCGSYHMDFLIASTDFEKTALKRKQRLKVYGIDAYFPTAEDIILFKIVPARYIDMADIEGILRRKGANLDREYLLDWAQKLSDEAQDMRIYNELQRLLNLR